MYSIIIDIISFNRDPSKLVQKCTCGQKHAPNGTTPISEVCHCLIHTHTHTHNTVLYFNHTRSSNEWFILRKSVRCNMPSLPPSLPPSPPPCLSLSRSLSLALTLSPSLSRSLSLALSLPTPHLPPIPPHPFSDVQECYGCSLCRIVSKEHAPI
jgi:hypothetical protein